MSRRVNLVGLEPIRADNENDRGGWGKL